MSTQNKELSAVENLIQNFIDKDYFFTKSEITSFANNYCGEMTDKSEILNLGTELVNSKHMKLGLLTYETMKTQIENKNFQFLCERLRYDQKFSCKLYEFITGHKLPKTNKKILTFLAENYKK